MTEVFDTIVMGAGWGGLAAARDLKDQGRSVVVLEASDHVADARSASPSRASRGCTPTSAAPGSTETSSP